MKKFLAFLLFAFTAVAFAQDHRFGMGVGDIGRFGDGVRECLVARDAESEKPIAKLYRLMLPILSGLGEATKADKDAAKQCFQEEVKPLIVSGKVLGMPSFSKIIILEEHGNDLLDKSYLVKVLNGPNKGAVVWTPTVTTLDPVLGDIVFLYDDTYPLPPLLSFDEGVLSNFWTAFEDGNRRDMNLYLSYGNMYTVPPNTAALIEDADGSYFKVRIAQGRRKGRAGWIFSRDAHLSQQEKVTPHSLKAPRSRRRRGK